MILHAMNRVTESNTLSQLVSTARGNLPMREVARRSGLSAAQISRIEGGLVESPTIETLTKIARALERDPQLLLIALDRVDEVQALQHLQQALEAPGAGDPAPRREQLEKRHGRVDELERLCARTTSEWQALAGRHDVLNAEAVELYQKAEFFARAAGDNGDQPEVAADYRERAKVAEADLARVQTELKAFERQGADVRKQLAKHESILAEARERLSATVQGIAAEVFVEVVVPFVREMEVGYWAALASSERERRDRDRLDAYIQKLGEDLASNTASTRATAELANETWQQIERAQKQLSELRNQLVHQPSDADFRRVAAAWNRLTPERRERVLEFVEDQRRLSMQEQLEHAPTKKEVMEIEQASARSRRS